MIPPTLEPELALCAGGITRVAGLDEAGRGPMAGPVMVGAVILPLDRPDLRDALAGVADSKQLAAPRREALFDVIREVALTSAVGAASSSEIDARGLTFAIYKAARRALDQLTPTPEALLVDGRLTLPGVAVPQRELINGDALSLSIAAASILAKVTRDRYMLALNAQYPQYEFARHKGYITPRHKQLLRQHGPCPEHRRSFAPVRALAQNPLLDGDAEP